MHDVAKLLYGREFERVVFGIGYEESDVLPYGLDYDVALQQVIKVAWRNLALKQKGRLKEDKFFYDPVNPRGEIRVIWELIKTYLPRRVDGRHCAPLHLYVCVGQSFDTHHGIDAFFWWEGVYVSIDISLRKKSESELKADLLVGPGHFERGAATQLAEEIAEILKRRRRRKRREASLPKARVTCWEHALVRQSGEEQ